MVSTATVNNGTAKNRMAKRGKASKAASKKADKPEKKTAMDTVLENSDDLRHTVAAIEKQFGEGAIMPLGSESDRRIEGISTSSLSLDMALGGQGIPCGRIIEVFGPESSGKTTLALHVIAESQKKGGIAAFIDAEHALDPSWARKLGVDLETLLVSQPSHGEEAMHITEMLIKSNAVDVIVIDSVAALVPKKELDGEIGDSHVGLQARLMSQSMRKLTGAIAKSKTSVIFINQIREKIGVMFGSPETTPGGRALKFYCSCRIDVRRIGQLKDGEEVVGQRVRTKIVKNKVAPPFRVAEFDMMHKDGVSYEGDLIDLGIEQKIISRTGAWFRYGEMQLGQGKEKARLFLKENPDIAAEIKDKILAAGGFDDLLAMKPAEVAAEASDEDEAPEE
ncbi:Protein RecA [Posidoniimonas polymericola]|uniref:Protein RecA n=2 Tax=Posidoniimonas polymericola TaxID=2528002 RepID=A0A5C5YR75_9BACT|nr:Protein RecA [Posidoniimonas polymericola]